MAEPTIKDRLLRLTLSECVRDLSRTMVELSEVVTLLADRIEQIEAAEQRRVSPSHEEAT